MIDDATAGAGNSGVPQHGDTLAPGTPTNLEVEHQADEFIKESAPPTESAPIQAEPAQAQTEAAAEPTQPEAAQAETMQAATAPSQTEPAAEPASAQAEQAPAQAEAAPAQVEEALAQAEAAPSASSQQELPPLSSYGPPARSFQEMGLHDEVVRALHEMGFSAPMPVQGNVFRLMMAGRDLIVQSRTGSGKTAAFGIPIAQGLIDPALNCRGGRVQALVLGPTRELALQVAGEVGRISKYRGLEVVPVYGGAPMGRQVEALAGGAQIVSGTPGRVLDHLRRSTLQLGQLRLLVLDEADEMLSMGFYEEILEIIKRCPRDRQTLLFSATMPEEIESLSRRHMRQPLKLQLSADSISVSEIAHAYYMVSGMGRPRDLMRVLEVERPDSAIIFCNTREETNLVAEYLRAQGLDAEPISSDLSQTDRERVMARSKARQLKYLVATDIAARGIDISDLSHVINYTFPESAEVYVHRTGRTGRAGKSGVAISLIGPRELGNFYYLKLTYKIRPTERVLPSEEELQTLREGQQMDRLAAEIPDEPRAEWRSLLRRVMASDAGERVLAGLLERYLAGPPRPIAHRPAPSHHAPHAHDGGEARRDTRPHHPERGDRGEHGGRSERGGLRAERPSAGYGRSERGGRPERGRDEGRGRDDGRGRDRGRRRDHFEEEYAESPSRRQQRLAREEQRRPGDADAPPAETQEPQRSEGRGRDRDRGPRRDRPERPSRGPRPDEAPAQAQAHDRPAAEASARVEPVAQAEPVESPVKSIVQDQAAPAEPAAPVAAAQAVIEAATQVVTEPASAGDQAPPVAAEAAPVSRISIEEPAPEAPAAVDARAEAAEEGEDEAETATDEETRKPRRRSGRSRKRTETTPPAEPARAAPKAQARAPRVDIPGPNDIIEVDDGREFWEAWVDSRNSVAAPAEREDAEEGEGEAEGDDDTSEGRARRSRRRRRNGDSKLTLAPGDLRVYLNLGRRDGLDEEQVQAMLRERGLPSFSTEVRSTHTYLAVPEAHVEWVVTSLNGHRIGNRSLLCERARK
jgi:ATP-dependent RNA helicase DeaD